MLNVLTVVWALEKGGTERAAINFASAYKKNGHDSRIIVTKAGGEREAEVANSGLRVASFASAATWTRDEGWFPDLIHLHSHGLDLAHVNWLRQVFGEKRFRLVETNVFGIPSPWEGALETSYQLSSWGLWQYSNRGGLIEKAAVMGNPVEPKNPPVNRAEARVQLGLAPKELVIGRVGQSSPRKWSPYYFSVLRELSEEQPLTFITVNPPEFLVEGLKKLPKVNHLHFPKILDGRELGQIYTSMDVMLHIADMGETFGYVLVEAELCRTPVVTLSTPWADNAQTEVVRHNRTGVVVQGSRNLARGVRLALEKEHFFDEEIPSLIARLESTVLAARVIQGEPGAAATARKISRPHYPSFGALGGYDWFWSRIPRRFAWILRGQVTRSEIVGILKIVPRLLRW